MTIKALLHIVFSRISDGGRLFKISAKKGWAVIGNRGGRGRLLSSPVGEPMASAL